MKALLAELRPALGLTALFAIFLGGLYPLVVWGGAQFLFPHAANGSLLIDADGTVRGSTLLAQHFASDRTFHPRPSSAGAGYDAASSSGSNLGPTSRKLADQIQADVATFRTRNGLAPETPIPADAVTRSSSGLDPHISPANAALQAGRVARARKLPVAQVNALIKHHTEDRDGGLLGEPRVNVLLLNRALDAVP